MFRTLPVVLLLSILCPFAAGCRMAEMNGASGPASDGRVHLNHVQVVGSHNSYKPGMYPGVLEMIALEDSSMASSLDYGHMPLREQLDLGLRSLELDVFYDPEGGLYSSPAGLAILESAGLPTEAPFDTSRSLEAPGFKVFHAQDIDFLSHCLRLIDCLEQIRRWSNAHPDHVPIVITMNAKDEVIERPGFTEPIPFDREAFDALDEEILSVFPLELLLRPDDVRGEAETLNAGVLENGWPPLDEVRGTVLFVLDETGAKQDEYIKDHPSLRDRVLFVNAPEGTPEAAVIIENDPEADGDRIRSLVESGYLVRTRSDSGTREARTGDTERREAAFESGAHVVTTDYYVEDQRFGTGYRVGIPGGPPARCNPVSAGPSCSSDDLEPGQ